jgi:hypothetical protein
MVFCAAIGAGIGLLNVAGNAGGNPGGGVHGAIPPGVTLIFIGAAIGCAFGLTVFCVVFPSPADCTRNHSEQNESSAANPSIAENPALTG